MCHRREFSLIKRRSSRIFNSSWNAASGCLPSWPGLRKTGTRSCRRGSGLQAWCPTLAGSARASDSGWRGEVMKYHKWIIAERNKLTVHPANPFEAAKVGAALSLPGRTQRRVEGIAILSTSHVLVDDTGVRQLGGLASELAKQTAGKAQEQQDSVLADAQQLNIDSLYSLPPMRTRSPAADAAGAVR